MATGFRSAERASLWGQIVQRRHLFELVLVLVFAGGLGRTLAEAADTAPSEWALLVLATNGSGQIGSASAIFDDVNALLGESAQRAIPIRTLIAQDGGWSPGEGEANLASWSGVRLLKFEGGVATTLSEVLEPTTGEIGSEAQNEVITGSMLRRLIESAPAHAKRLCLVLYGHGGALNGLCKFHADFLDFAELRRGIQEGLDAAGRSKIDLVALHNCHGASLEQLSVFEGRADAVVAAEAITRTNTLPLSLWAKLLDNDPSGSPARLATDALRLSCLPDALANALAGYCISSFDMCAFPELASRWESLGSQIHAALQAGTVDVDLLRHRSNDELGALIRVSALAGGGLAGCGGGDACRLMDMGVVASRLTRPGLPNSIRMAARDALAQLDRFVGTRHSRPSRKFGASGVEGDTTAHQHSGLSFFSTCRAKDYSRCAELGLCRAGAWQEVTRALFLEGCKGFTVVEKELNAAPGEVRVTGDIAAIRQIYVEVSAPPPAAINRYYYPARVRRERDALLVSADMDPGMWSLASDGSIAPQTLALVVDRIPTGGGGHRFRARAPHVLVRGGIQTHIDLSFQMSFTPGATPPWTMVRDPLVLGRGPDASVFPFRLRADDVLVSVPALGPTQGRDPLAGGLVIGNVAGLHASRKEAVVGAARRFVYLGDFGQRQNGAPWIE